MHYSRAIILVNTVLIYLNYSCNAVNLSYNHRKRELLIEKNTRNYNNFEDPGYTKQNENDVIYNGDNVGLEKIYSNTTNYIELNNPAGHMFHLIYIPLQLNYKPKTTPIAAIGLPHQTPKNQYSKSYENNLSKYLADRGPHKFPEVLATNYHNVPTTKLKLVLPNSNLNQQLTTTHNNDIKVSEVGANMEAPFIPSQFLGYDQDFGNLHPQQHLLSSKHYEVQRNMQFNIPLYTSQTN